MNAYTCTNALGFARVRVLDTSRAFLCRISSIEKFFGSTCPRMDHFLAKFFEIGKDVTGPSLWCTALGYVESRVTGTEIAITCCPMLYFLFSTLKYLPNYLHERFEFDTCEYLNERFYILC